MLEVVVKVSGKVVDDDALLARLAAGIATLVRRGAAPIVVHGGGRQIDALAERLGIVQTVVDGRRVTSAATLEVVQMGLLGLVQPRLLGALARAGVRAVGWSGLSGMAIVARRRAPVPTRDGQTIDLGLVGDVEEVEVESFRAAGEAGVVPVVACLAGTRDGTLLNVNADTLAARIAAVLGARRLVVVSDVDGLYRDVSDEGSRVERIAAEDVPADGAWSGASGGMRPKLAAAAAAVRGGVEEVRLVGPKALATLEAEVFGEASRGTIVFRGHAFGEEKFAVNVLGEMR